MYHTLRWTHTLSVSLLLTPRTHVYTLVVMHTLFLLHHTHTHRYTHTHSLSHTQVHTGSLSLALVSPTPQLWSQKEREEEREEKEWVRRLIQLRTRWRERDSWPRQSRCYMFDMLLIDTYVVCTSSINKTLCLHVCTLQDTDNVYYVQSYRTTILYIS